MQLNQYRNYLRRQSEYADHIVTNNLINGAGTFVARAIVEIVGGKGNDAIVLSEVLYWAGINPDTMKPRLSHRRGDHLWIVRTYDEYAKRTGLCSGRMVRKVMDRLEKAGFIVKETHKSPYHLNENGEPQRALFVRPNWAVLGKALNDWLDAQGEKPETSQKDTSETSQKDALGEESQKDTSGETSQKDASLLTKSTTKSTTDIIGEISDEIPPSSPTSPSSFAVSGPNQQNLDADREEFLAAQSLRKAEKYAVKPVSRDSGRSTSKKINSDALPTVCKAIAEAFGKHADLSRVKITANQEEELVSRVMIKTEEHASPQAMYERYPVRFLDWLDELAYFVVNKTKERLTGKTIVKFARAYDYNYVGFFEYLERKGQPRPEPIGGVRAKRDQAVREQIQRRIDARDEADTSSFVLGTNPISTYEDAADEVEAYVQVGDKRVRTTGKKVGRHQDKAIYEIDGHHFIIVNTRYLEEIDVKGMLDD